MGRSQPRNGFYLEAGCESGFDMQGVFLVGEGVASDMVAGDVMTSDHPAMNLPYYRCGDIFVGRGGTGTGCLK